MVARTQVPGNGAEVDVPLPGGKRLRAKVTSSATAPDALVVWNPESLEDPVAVLVYATAYASDSVPLEFVGRQRVWSDDLHRLWRWWDLKFEDPYRAPVVGPPDPHPWESHLERVRWAYAGR